MVTLLAFVATLAGIQTRPDSLPRVTVVLVRHAERASSTDADSPLSAAGHARATALDSALADSRINAIVVTQFRRTAETAAPAAARHGLTPIVVPNTGSLAEHVRAVAEAVRGQRGVILVVGHSNTIPRIVHELGGPALPDLCDGSYSEFFTVEVGEGISRTLRSRYGAPDPPGTEQCAMVSR